MKYWIFIVTKSNTQEGLVSAEEVLHQRIEDKFWGLGYRTRNRLLLEKGDRVVFYVGYPTKCFSATATLASGSFDLNEEQKKIYGHGKDRYLSNHGVFLENIEQWDAPRFVPDLIDNLSFIENKEYWGTYFQGGIAQISQEDFNVILGNKKALHESNPRTEADIIKESEFALENHLEDFMDKNWNNVNFGANLKRFDDGEQSGRQYPVGTWRIDFLCLDNDTNDFVVIELKRGQSSDETIGQVLRYMGWVKENLCQENQKVRGIIICHEVDKGLRYAVQHIESVEILTYKVDFALSKFS
jgi:hypothetical protein